MSCALGAGFPVPGTRCIGGTLETNQSAMPDLVAILKSRRPPCGAAIDRRYRGAVRVAIPMAKLSAPDRVGNDPAEQAIAIVLRAERDARASIERTQHEAGQIAEAARANARAVGERTERRIRAVVGAFERELAERLTEIEAQAAASAQPHPLRNDELAALGRAVDGLAQVLIGARP